LSGRRLSPWLGHLMVSRQEAARPLLTPGEVMQLPADEALVQVSGVPPIRATKVRYYLDRELAARVAAPPSKPARLSAPTSGWTAIIEAGQGSPAPAGEETDEGGLRIEPELDAPVEGPPIAAEPEAWLEPEVDADDLPQAEQARRFRAAARVAALDPDDGIPL
jgi:type IV secretion system protein VirD4